MNLTKTERLALNHRLEASDAIAEALDADDREVYEICKLLLADRLEDALNRDTGLTLEVIRDCVEGSTWVGSAQGNRAKNAAYYTLWSLSQKLKELGLDDVFVPEY